MCTCQTQRSIDDCLREGCSALPSLRPPMKLAFSAPHPCGPVPARNADPEKQCGAAFGWTSGSTFISRRTLGSVRLLLSTPLVQLRAA